MVEFIFGGFVGARNDADEKHVLRKVAEVWW
jgi:hypothetical protein